ncbi:MAG: hypothetical protein RL398_323 [Planctomycetota bacterium]|jgi:hypothetical protein
MKILIASAVAALLAVAAPAQISGSINRTAPTVSQSIAMGEQKVELSYTAIRFGQGAWQKVRENTAAHERFNANAEKKPIGSVKTSVAVNAAGKEVPAGEYAMFFTVNERAGWILNLKPKAGGDAIMWRMHLQNTEHKSDCMSITLAPSAEDGKCSITVSFGDQYVTVPVTVGGSDAGGEKKEGGK